MIFDDFPVEDSLGAILAHTVRLSSRKVIKKGTVLEQHHIDMLKDSGRTSIMAAQLEPGDVSEDAAAHAIAHALLGGNIQATPASTGRCNLMAAASGVVVFDPDLITQLNLVIESITIATLNPHDFVRKGQMVATIKIIPFSVTDAALQETLDKIKPATGLHIAPIDTAARIGLVLSNTQGGREQLLDKASKTLQKRLEDLGCQLAQEKRCDHETRSVATTIGELQQAKCNLIIICGATATVDRNDVVPAGIKLAGGAIEHYGMPVDPGNLLLLGRLDKIAVIGMPGCARSPKFNGFDWVLQRVLAGLTFSRQDFASLGVGGLLDEMPGRPLSRDRAVSDSDPALIQPDEGMNIAAIVLAAGRSMRMGEVNKLLSKIDGTSLVRHAVEAALQSTAVTVTVVTGHEADDIKVDLEGLDVTFVHNPDYKDCMSTSVQAGLTALKDDIDGAVVCLGDMPRVNEDHINKLIEAFDPAMDQAICVSCYGGKRGNPVLWSSHYFSEIMQLSGDAGARQILRRHGSEIIEVNMDSDAVLKDIDTPEALKSFQQ